MVMGQLAWGRFIDKYNNSCHLVVAVLPRESKRIRISCRHVKRIIHRLGSSGDYALKVARANEVGEIHIVFQREADAALLGRLSGATQTSRYPGWATRQLFSWDEPTAELIEQWCSSTESPQIRMASRSPHSAVSNNDSRTI